MNIQLNIRMYMYSMLVQIYAQLVSKLTILLQLVTCQWYVESTYCFFTVQEYTLPLQF